MSTRSTCSTLYEAENVGKVWQGTPKSRRLMAGLGESTPSHIRISHNVVLGGNRINDLGLGRCYE